MRPAPFQWAAQGIRAGLDRRLFLTFFVITAPRFRCALSPMASLICRASVVYAWITINLPTSLCGLVYILNAKYVFKILMNSKARANLVL